VIIVAHWLLIHSNYSQKLFINTRVLEIYFCSATSIRCGTSGTGNCWFAADIGVWTYVKQNHIHMTNSTITIILWSTWDTFLSDLLTSSTYHTWTRDRFKQLLNFGCTMNKLMFPELVRRIFDQFDERNQ
jgi:hypothetical protein